MNSYQQEKAKEIEENNRQIKAVYDAIKSEIETLGLSIEVTNKNHHGEALSEDRVVITSSEISDFRVDILGRCWNKPNKVSMHFNNQRVVSKVVGRHLDGSDQWGSDRYEFKYQLKDSELAELGFNKIDYCYGPTRELSKEFKADKNPKLIINDVIPRVKQYLSFVKIASERVDKKIEKENAVLAMQNRLYKYADVNHGEIRELRTRSFEIPNIGYVEIDTHGNIELSRKVTEEDILKLIDDAA